MLVADSAGTKTDVKLTWTPCEGIYVVKVSGVISQ